MKLTALLLVAGFMQVTAAVYSQEARLTFSVKESHLEQVFELIEQHSGYSFIYNHEQLKGASPVTADFKESALADVLERCLQGTGLTFEMVSNRIIIKKAVPQQPERRMLKGKVSDEKGHPLPGVTVVIKGTSMGTATDTDGSYSVTLPGNVENIVLIYSFVGMEVKEIAYTG
ncbi:MAG: carboxypeptidase-like regulatory domain-containing protein, partial [Odoribacter sp.]|nr:carboxypeptidase-like regulatory domain-containing protein [Odoribacter sp.]